MKRQNKKPARSPSGAAMTEEPREHAPRPPTVDHYCRKRKPRCQSGPLFVVDFVKLHLTALENSITLYPYDKDFFDVPSSALLSCSLGDCLFNNYSSSPNEC